MEEPTTTGIEVAGLAKSFQHESKQVHALQDINLRVRPGEVVALLGPSGCGKTTLLRSIAGLEQPDTGRIEVNRTPMFDSRSGVDLAPEKRRIGMVFQSYALWPHMTVAENIGYPLKRARVAKSEIGVRVREILDTVDCSGLGNRYVSQLSGGQQQRIALARALVARPSVILFDEPLSNLDARLRDTMQFELLELHKRLSYTAIHVTHDQTEAMTIADRIAVMREGRIVQFGDPQSLYESPADRGVAEFMGSSQFIDGEVHSMNGDATIEVKSSLGMLVCPAGDYHLRPGQSVSILARPESLLLRPAPEDNSDRVLWTQAEVDRCVFQGSRWVHVLRAGGQEIRVDALTQLGKVGDAVQLGLPHGQLPIFPPSLSRPVATAGSTD